MKRKITHITLVLAVILLATNHVQAQKFKDLDVSPMDRVAFPLSHNKSDKLVRVTYSRPQLKGRTVESLTPNGKVWRTGANEATEITFYKDATFSGKSVKAGTYSLFTIPGEKEWTIILSSDLNVWGAYDYKQKNDVLRVTVPLLKDKKSIEAFTMAFDDDSTLYLAWGNLRVSIPIEFSK